MIASKSSIPEAVRFVRLQPFSIIRPGVVVEREMEKPGVVR
jgi:hypothetical protein